MRVPDEAKLWFVYFHVYHARANDKTYSANLLRLRVIYLCDRFGISQDRVWNLDETAVRMVPAGERGWT